MAMAAKELNTAEVAFAAIDEVDKLHFVLKVGLDLDLDLDLDLEWVNNQWSLYVGL